MCPLGGRLVSGSGSVLSAATMVCHCLLVETSKGLCLVDTGLGTADVAHARKRLGPAFVALTRPRCDVRETAKEQVAQLGFSPRDVRHVIVTHLDLDHAGGLPDFPEAMVHVFAPEHEAAMKRETAGERARYRPVHWSHGPRFVAYDGFGEPWFGFPAVRDLSGLPPEILLVPLVGHTRGHSAVAVQTGESWLLHAGDAYFAQTELDARDPSCPPALAAFQRIVCMDRGPWEKNRERLRELVRTRSTEVRVFCAHDPSTM